MQAVGRTSAHKNPMVRVKDGDDAFINIVLGEEVRMPKWSKRSTQNAKNLWFKYLWKGILAVDSWLNCLSIILLGAVRKPLQSTSTLRE